MKDWKYLQNQKVKVTCKSDTKNIGSTEYYGCCKNCDFVRGEYGDHWTSDKVWCSCPVPIKKGQTIEIVNIKKYRIQNS
jgi:hypothetical protein